MRQIIKSEPPQEFLDYLQTPGVSYDGLGGDTKKALRQRLLEDQGYICCYCGRRISNDEHTKIEHIKCQKFHGELALDFSNMLASCDGGDLDRQNKTNLPHKCHCDAKKGNQDIPISPLEEMTALFSFFDDGTVKGKGVIGKEMVRILGLDAQFLNTQRRTAIEGFDENIHEDLQSELLLLNEKKDGQYEEFCFVLEQHIMDLINQE